MEGLTFLQWSIANMAILYKLVGKGKLGGSALMDYLLYTTKFYQLVQKYSLVSFLLYDREYRQLQSSMGYRWGTDVNHLHTLHLQPGDNPIKQVQQSHSQKRGGEMPRRSRISKEKGVMQPSAEMSIAKRVALSLNVSFLISVFCLVVGRSTLI